MLAINIKHMEWSNTKPTHIDDIVSFYQIYSSGNLYDISNFEDLAKLNLDPVHFLNSFEKQSQAHADLLQYLMSNKLYNVEVLPIEYVGNHFFRFYTKLPAQASQGIYSAQIYLLDESMKLIDSKNLDFELMSSAKLSKTIMSISQNAVLYSILCIVVAIVVGLISGFLF